MEYLALNRTTLRRIEGAHVPLETVGEEEVGEAFAQSQRMDVCLTVTAV